jgi:hypothetical protein
MSPKFQKQSALKLVGRIIHCAKHMWISREAEGGRKLFLKPALGFIPVISR